MARAATTSVFNAIAEPRRREILTLLRAGERSVADLADHLGLSQPGASEHLRVLREVGLVHDRREGEQRSYGLDARGLQSVHAWAGGFESFWQESFDRLDAYVQCLKELRSVFPTAALRDRAVAVSGAVEGGNQTLDNLDTYVTHLGNDER
ncbi:metalloregulator ArsR/SmtB family transcription factor [Parenemella sanctibonifatiensis]|uniref:Transcriptional regulator n=1 Tax=Parenemella sanctibonifatiensis TaxID=2016505 RepID=A0A255E4B8_9ACTN|nr:metalloregulator ArsR/SmtB family transcription factor [Parenemella sanctibonifatiensis]OYN86394.1 transcriptional regulator [Parenemella sanctibonifatiensis]